MKKMNVLRGLAGAAMAVALGAGHSPALAQADAIAVIKERGKLMAGVKYDTPPFGFQNKDNEIVGFDVDIVRKVAEDIGVPVEFVAVTSPTRIPMLASGNVDLVAASMTHTKKRDEAIDFSITYYTGGQSLLVKKGSDIRGLDDLAGKDVAVQQGTTLEKNLATMAPEANALSFKDYNSAWLALRQGRADALTGSLNILQGFAKNDGEFVTVGGRFSEEPFGIGVRQGDSVLRDRINFVIQELWETGEYHAIYEKWFGVQPDVAIEVWP